MAEYWEKSLVAQLEQLGESEVRIRFARGDYGQTGGLKSLVVKDWLDSKESARKSAREVREIELSEDANPIARKVLRGTTFAKIIAILVIILIAAASGVPEMVKPGTSEQESAKDRFECLRASESTSSWSLFGLGTS